MKRILRQASLLILLSVSVSGFSVNVKVNADKGIENQSIISKIEGKLSFLLTEINNAQAANRPLELGSLGLNSDARQSLEMLWVVAHFYCCDEEVTDRLWNFKKSYMVRSIPLIIVPDDADSWANGTYQEAVVEFDLQGNIIDFRFSFSSQLGESLEKCSGSAVEAERKLEILAWCDRLRTAYNEHNLAFMKKIFSDNALIITGKIVKETNREFGTTSEKVVYSKQNKKQYMINLARCFKNNKWIDVEFDEVGIGDLDSKGCGTVTQSSVNLNFYGVRLHQKWKSTNYSDEGYVFLLWNFSNEEEPQIEVRTWQPDIVNGKKISTDEVISIGDFERDIMNL